MAKKDVCPNCMGTGNLSSSSCSYVIRVECKTCKGTGRLLDIDYRELYINDVTELLKQVSTTLEKGD